MFETISNPAKAVSEFEDAINTAVCLLGFAGDAMSADTVPNERETAGYALLAYNARLQLEKSLQAMTALACEVSDRRQTEAMSFNGLKAANQ